MSDPKWLERDKERKGWTIEAVFDALERAHANIWEWQIVGLRFCNAMSRYEATGDMKALRNARNDAEKLLDRQEPPQIGDSAQIPAISEKGMQGMKYAEGDIAREPYLPGNDVCDCSREEEKT